MTNHDQGWTNPYPAADSSTEVLPELDIPEPARQRRWTILLRWLLVIPMVVLMFFVGIIAFFVTVAGWFAALVLGRLPTSIASFLSGYLIFRTRIDAYAMLLVDRYPPASFHQTDHPVQVEVHPGHLNRLAVFFRLILVIPAAIVESLVVSGWYAVAVISWIVTLVMGRMPQALYEATTATARYTMRLEAYMMLLTPAYPKRLFGDGIAPPQIGETMAQRRSGTRPLFLSGAAKALLVVFIVFGLVSGGFSGTGTSSNSMNSSSGSVR